MSALHRLVERGNDFERLRQLIQRGENPNDVDNEGNTPLHIVASRAKNSQHIEGSVRMARVLIESGAEINERNVNGHTPLLLAVKYENRRLVEFLLDRKADVNMADENAVTPLHIAIKPPNDFLNFARLTDYFDSRKDVLEMVKTISRFNPDLDAINSENETPVLLAAKYQDYPVLKELLKRKADVNILDNLGRSAMYHAVNQSLYKPISLGMVIELLRQGSPIYEPVIENLTPMDMLLRNLRVYLSVVEIEAKSLFRGFLLGDESLTPNHVELIGIISRLKSVALNQFIVVHGNERNDMAQDVLDEGCSVLNMAQRGFFFTTDEEKYAYSRVFDTLKPKLANSEYPLYHDLIVCGIGRKKLVEEFIAACIAIQNTGRSFFEEYTARFECSFLSLLDIFNCIVAFSID